jgi:hypothetical protein
MWRGRAGPTPGARGAGGQCGRAAAPLHVARPKGSPGANKVPQGLFIKIIFKKG